MKKLIVFLCCVGIGVGIGMYYARIGISIKTTTSRSNTTSYSISTPPKDSEQGMVQSIEGAVQWESRTATEPATITKPVAIQQGEELFTGSDGKAAVQFPEGILFTMSPNSHLIFTQTLPTHYVLNQSEGVVRYQYSRSSPLAIRTLHLLIQMDEGDMQISTDIQTNKVVITVTHGVATLVYNDLHNTSTVVTVHAGETLRYNDETRAVLMLLK